MKKSRKGVEMKFSFIIGTLNRTKELEYCLKSLMNQIYKNFEIIIIDQSENDLTEKMISVFESENIVYRHVDFCGLSKARNAALRLATGDYICLTDDDAYYHQDYLLNLVNYFKKNDFSIVSGYMWNAMENVEFIDYSNLEIGKVLSIRQIIRNCPSPAITFPKKIVDEIGMFDEDFGVGAKYGAGEETDFLLRAFWHGYSTIYCSDVKVDHPHKNAKISNDESSEKRKVYNYSFGIGAMYRKQFAIGKTSKLVIPWMEQIIKNIVKNILHRKNAKTIRNRFMQGFKSYNLESVREKI